MTCIIHCRHDSGIVTVRLQCVVKRRLDGDFVIVSDSELVVSLYKNVL